MRVTLVSPQGGEKESCVTQDRCDRTCRVRYCLPMLARSENNKRTRLAASADLSVLAQDCDGRHSHLPWSVRQDGDRLQFDTAEEAQYPTGLCAGMADLFKARLLSSGRASWPDASPPPFASGSPQGAPPLIPQFRAIQAGLSSGGDVTRPEPSSWSTGQPKRSSRRP